MAGSTVWNCLVEVGSSLGRVRHVNAGFIGGDAGRTQVEALSACRLSVTVSSALRSAVDIGWMDYPHAPDR